LCRNVNNVNIKTHSSQERATKILHPCDRYHAVTQSYYCAETHLTLNDAWVQAGGCKQRYPKEPATRSAVGTCDVIKPHSLREMPTKILSWSPLCT